MAYDGSIRINTKIDGKGFNTGVKSMMSSLGSLAAALGVTFGVAAIVNFAKTSVETSMQMEAGWQGLRYMANAYGRDIKQIETFLKDYTSDGLVPMMNAQAAYKNMLARGYDTEQLEAMLLVMKDSSVYLRKGQLDIGQAIENTTMGLRTERSILTDSSGIEQNMYKMWQAYAKEQGTTISALTKQQKIIAEFQGFMKEGAVYAGAAAAYTETYAGRVAQLTAAMIGLKVSVGNMITPVLNAILPTLIKLVHWFTVLFNIAGRVMNLLFGSNVGAVDLEKAAEAAGELGENTEAAGEAAKGALAAFDKINVLKQPEAATGSEEPGPGEEVPDPTKGVGAAIDELAAKVEKFKEDLIAFFEPMKEPFARLKEAFTTLGITLSTILSPLWEEVLKPFFGWIGQEVAPRVIELLAIALENLNIIIEANKPLLTDIWENTLKPILTWTGDTITDILDWLIVKLTDFGIWAKDNPENIRTITTLLGGFFLAWKTANLAVTIAGVITKMVDFVWQLGLMAINLGIETVAWITNTAAKIANTIATTAQTVATWLWNAAATAAAVATAAFGFAMNILTSPITLVVVAIVALIAIVYLLITHWDDVKKFAVEAWDKIKEAWVKVSDWFNTNVVKPLRQWFSHAWIDIKEFFTGAWDSIKLAWGKAKDWFDTSVITPVKNFFETAWETIKLKVTGVWTAITTAWGGAKNWFDGVINPIKTWFDTQWNAISAKVIGVWTSITSGTAWGGAKTWFDGVINGIKGWFDAQWNAIGSKVTGVWDTIKTAWGGVSSWFWSTVIWPVQDYFSGQWDLISSKVTGVWTSITGSQFWGGAVSWFQLSIIDPIVGAFDLGWSTIGGFISGAFTNLEEPVKGVINNVIGFLNGLLFGLVDLINGVVNLINSVSIDVPDWVASTFGIPDPFGFSLNTVGYPAGIPYLATGAVIPANAPFAAVLGDQRHGTNLEAPESLIRKIIREEMGGNNINETVEVRVPVYLDSQKIYEGQERVRRQRGRSLFAGGFAG